MHEIVCGHPMPQKARLRPLGHISDFWNTRSESESGKHFEHFVN